VLTGVRVANLGVNVPPAVAAARLAELGASVTKVEPPGGDPVEVAAPEWYAALTAGQDVVVVDLKAGVPDELLASCDVLLTSTRPQALVRLGLGAEDVRARFPRLVHVAIVGHAAPDDHVPGHDLTYLADVGLLAPPALPRTLVADLGGAERAVSAALALLLARERTGDGGRAEVALADAAAAFAQPLRHGLTAPTGILGGGYPLYGMYRASDGWIAVAALEPRFRDGLLAELGLATPDADALASVFATRTATEWATWAAERDLPIAAVR
jgi:crotonobetainyl-CoA:carnitine CoA-transferase CaiB-like acyl-CoA transferase